jgi:3',5'-cyclic AMP phosphodiesterase CpdA
MFRAILISDTHLGEKTQHFRQNWARVADWIRAEAPDLVINTGDLSLDGADLAVDLDMAAAAHRTLGCPVQLVPGNHDVGDHPRLSSGRQVIDMVRRQRYLDRVGPDFWVQDVENWRLIGLNALLIGSELAAEAEQKAWLEDLVAGAGDRRLALFLHKPFFIDRPDETVMSYWVVDPERRDDYRFLLDHPNLRLLASGHLHQHRSYRHGPAQVLWAPSVAFVVGPGMQEDLGGLRRTGVVDLRFDRDMVEATMLELPALENPTIDEIIDEIYPPIPAARQA